MRALAAAILIVVSLCLPVAAAGDDIEVRHERYEDDAVGEQVVTARVVCADDGAALCMPEGYFIGLHSAPEGHDARAGANSDWRSASAGYRTQAAGHDIAAQAGTFHFFMLQYLYLEVFVDGERYGFFEAVPMPLP